MGYKATSPDVRCDGPDQQIDVDGKLNHSELWSPMGSCCWNGGDCKDSSTNPKQNIRWVFPTIDAAKKTKGPGTHKSGGQAMHGEYTVRIQLPSEVRSKCTQEKGPCTIQWLFMTGNSPDSYPEAFRNCADFTIKDSAQAALRGSASKP